MKNTLLSSQNDFRLEIKPLDLQMLRTKYKELSSYGLFLSYIKNIIIDDLVADIVINNIQIEEAWKSFYQSNNLNESELEKYLTENFINYEGFEEKSIFVVGTPRYHKPSSNKKQMKRIISSFNLNLLLNSIKII